MIGFDSIEDIPEERYIKTLLAGDEDEDMEDPLFQEEDDEDAGKDEEDNLPVDIIHIN